MARVCLHIADLANRLTIKGLLERRGHLAVEEDAQIFIADSPARAVELLPLGPVLMLTTLGALGEAVAAMEKGVFGYVFVPLQPREITLMVDRALQSRAPETNTPLNEASAPHKSLQEVEAEHILMVLRHCKHNQAKAAKILGIGRNTLWRKLKKIEATHSED